MGGRPTVNRHDCLLFGEMGGNLPHRVTFELLASGKSSRGHVVLHHGAFLELVLDRVHMIWVGCFKKLFKVIGRLSRLVLKNMLDGDDELLVRVANVLIVITIVIAGGDRDLLGSPLWSPLVTSSTPLCTLGDCLGWHPLTTAGCCLPTVLHKNGLDCFLARGMPGGDVEELLCGLWLVTTELVQQCSEDCAGPKR
jgi:hypothetical protein